MVCCKPTAALLLFLFVLSASAKSSQRYGSTTDHRGNAGQASSLTQDQRVSDSHYGVKNSASFFFSPEESTLPPTVPTTVWKHTAFTKNGRKKEGSADEELRRSYWTNEIVRQQLFAYSDQDEETENAPNETSSGPLAGSEPASNRRIADDTVRVEVRRTSKGNATAANEDSRETKLVGLQRDRDRGNINMTKHRSSYDAVAEATSNVDEANDNSDEFEQPYDDESDYDVADEDYEDDDDDVQYHDDDSQTVGEQEDGKTDEKSNDDKKSVGREAVVYQEYELSPDASRGIDYDTTYSEVVNEVQVVNQPVRRRRRKGRLGTTKKTRGRTRKRRRKRPPVEPVGVVKKRTRTRRPTSSAGARRRKTKARRRRKGQTNNKRRTRKNRRNKQTTSSSGFDFGGGNGNENKFESGYTRPDVVESTKPRLQQSAALQGLQQQQQQDGYGGQYYVPPYVDIHDGHNSGRIVAASADVRGQSSQQAADNLGGHASVSSRIPPIHDHRTSSLLQRYYFDPRQYHRHQQLAQDPRQQYSSHLYHHRQHERQYRQPATRQYYHQQQQPAPTYSRHQQQIHFIVPSSSDFDLRRIQQVMSALGLDNIGGPQRNADGQVQLEFIDGRHPSSNSDYYRESHHAVENLNNDVGGKQHPQLSLSGTGVTSTDDAAARRGQHLRQQRSISGRRRASTTTQEDGKEARRRGRPAKRRDDGSESATDDDNDVDNDKEYVDNSDIEITTRSPEMQTTPLIPL